MRFSPDRAIQIIFCQLECLAKNINYIIVWDFITPFVFYNSQFKRLLVADSGHGSNSEYRLRQNKMASTIMHESMDIEDQPIQETPGGISSSLQEQIYATIYGQCIGDAVGIMTKHMGRETAKQIFQRNGILEYNQQISDTYKIPLQSGDWTDNSDQMILMLQSLIDNRGQINPNDFASKLYNWVKHGFKELGDKHDHGIDKTVVKILMDDQFTQHPHKVAEKAWKSSCMAGTNSCLTRTSILGIHEWKNTEQVEQNVSNICRTTHCDPVCVATSILIAVAISLMLQKNSKIYKDDELNVDALAAHIYSCAKKYLPSKQCEQLNQYLRCTELSKLHLQQEGDDDFKCLGAGLWALKQHDFLNAIAQIVLSGGQAHTNGAVAGALLGCKLGQRKDIPEKWLRLKHIEWLAGNIERFLAMLEIYRSPRPRSHQHEEMISTHNKRLNIRGRKPPPENRGNMIGVGGTARHQSIVAVDTFSRAQTSQQICATLYGQCIGDAIGLLTENMTKDEAEFHYSRKLPIEYKHKVDDKHRGRWAEGDWTNESDQMFLIMQSLIDNNGEIIPHDFAKRMVYWKQHGFPDLKDTCGLGIGKTTLTLLCDPHFIAAPLKVAETLWRYRNKTDAPNGGVMRTSVLGVNDWWDTNVVMMNARTLCMTTHFDPRCQASAVAVSVAISLMLQKKFYDGVHYDIPKLVEATYEYACGCLETKQQKEELKWYMNCTDLDKLNIDEQDVSGYTFTCMGVGFWALRQKDFKNALTEIVMRGGSADSNGAVAGALLGCKLGDVRWFPESWLRLKHRTWLDDKLHRLLEMMNRRYETVMKQKHTSSE
ncbi:hypothetical protein ACJMK2_041377 [Sinanodonta woodiana]|uniref:Uncharacterized protein n=1 Tax=Sinanodonta woodiana TaxID=1069815 RepID=A0ABD3W4L6_SINWO